jgi:hypothetical protein
MTAIISILDSDCDIADSIEFLMYFSVFQTGTIIVTFGLRIVVRKINAI